MHLPTYQAVIQSQIYHNNNNSNNNNSNSSNKNSSINNNSSNNNNQTEPGPKVNMITEKQKFHQKVRSVCLTQIFGHS